MWPFWTTLSAILFSIFSTLKPGVVLFSTMKPLTWLSATSRAQMIGNIAPRSVADPPLLAVENPGVALALRRRQSGRRWRRNPPAARSGRSSRSSPSAPSAAATSASALPIRRCRWSPSPGRCARRRRSQNDGSTRAISIWTKPNSPGFRLRSRSPAFQAHRCPAPYRRQQFEGKGVLDPVLRDDRRDLGLHERAHPLHDRESRRRSRSR